jgi:hypothetical protein
MPQRRVHDAEMCFTQSLELSRRQGARGWELRTATDLAALWEGQGRTDHAHELVRPSFMDDLTNALVEICANDAEAIEKATPRCRARIARGFQLPDRRVERVCEAAQRDHLTRIIPTRCEPLHICSSPRMTSSLAIVGSNPVLAAAMGVI